MTELLNGLAIGSVAVLGISKAFAVGFYDSLLRRQFEAHYESWEADGSHRGMNWRPPASRSPSFFGQSHAWNRWLFNTPDWARDDKRALGTLFRFRVAEGLAAAGIVVVLCAVMMAN